MAKTRGFNTFLGSAGTKAFHAALRQATYVGAEAGADPVKGGTLPQTVAILRHVQTAAGDGAAGIKATFGQVPGLAKIAALVHLPGSGAQAAWIDKATGASIVLKDNQRLITLIDVPASSLGAVTFGRDIVLPSDRISITDATYGAGAIFKVLEISSYKAAGMITVLTEYARES